MRLWRFRTRSTLRDKESDKVRLSLVLAAIESAIASAELELAGLARRRDAAMADAAFAFDSADGDFLQRDQAEERAIQSAESALVTAQQRCTQLQKQLAMLREMEGALKTFCEQI